jgi:hypothetical protein
LEFEMADYVRVVIALAAQWRVRRAIGPTAVALVGLPVAMPRQPQPQPVALATPRGEIGHNDDVEGGPGTGRPKPGYRAWN